MKKMKRQGSPDPVYPFGDQTPAPLPPFLNAGSGLKAEGLSLSVQTSDPLTVGLGGVTLKIGEGLSVVDGKLNSGARINTIPPLSKTGEDLSLKTDTTLVVNSTGELGVALQPTLVNGTAGVGLKTPTSPLQVTNDGTLNLKTGPGLKLDNGALQVSVGYGMNINPGGQLTLYPLEPLAWDAGSKSLILNYGNGLTVVDGKLQIIGAPLQEARSALIAEESSAPRKTSMCEELTDGNGVTFYLEGNEEAAGSFIKRTLSVYSATGFTGTFTAEATPELTAFIRSHPKNTWHIPFPSGSGTVSAQEGKVVVTSPSTPTEVNCGSCFYYFI